MANADLRWKLQRKERELDIAKMLSENLKRLCDDLRNQLDDAVRAGRSNTAKP